MFGKESDRVLSSVRFSFGYGTNLVDIQYAAEKIAKIVKRVTA
jgi:cysteine desulfurase